MLLHQLILAVVPAAKRLDSWVLAVRSVILRLVTRGKLGGSDLQGT